MRVWKLGAALFCAILVAGCGGNSTPVGVTVSPVTATVLLNQTQQFTDTVTGTSTSTVNWLICLPAATTTTSTTVVPPPINCGQLTGFGTITSTGLYTAPSAVPSPATFVVAAQSTVNTTIYGVATVTVDSGVRVSLNPTSATIGTSQSLASISSTQNFTFTPTVTGTSNQGLTWSVTSGATTVVGGNSTIGFVCPNSATPLCNGLAQGTYIAPTTAPGAVTVTATSAADASKSATAAVSVVSLVGITGPALTSIAPSSAAEGSVQQDVYLNGSDFFSNSIVLANGVPVPTVFISSSLLRATIPAALLVSPDPCSPQLVVPNIPIQVEWQNAIGVSQTANLNITPSRPVLVASSPDSTVVNAANVGVTLTGGYFSPCTTVSFNNQLVPVNAGNTTRVMNTTIPGASLGLPGLYPIVVQNTDVVPPNPSVSAVNLAVEPTSFPSAPSSSITVGSNPSAIAIDPALNLAVVTNAGDGTASIINLQSMTVVSVVPVGNDPTGVAIDDQLALPLHHLAVVVNNADNSVTSIDLTTFVPTTIVLPNTAVPPAPQPLPFSIGINSFTHRALVALQSTDMAVVLDVSSGTPTLVQTIGGNFTSYGVGSNPAVAIDPLLNWAIVTPGGVGTINIVDLGLDPTPGDMSLLGPIGRLPSVIGSVAISATVRGIGVNTVTHEVLLADPQAGTLGMYSLLNNSITNVTSVLGGIPINEFGFSAAAVNPLSNIGIAINNQTMGSTGANTAIVVDMQNSNLVQTVTGLSTPEAVAVDAVTNLAYIVNQSGTVSVLSLGPAGPGQFRPLQILESSPAVTFVTSPPSQATLTITGVGFSTGTPQVFLDGTALPSGDVTVLSDRQIVATVPANMLTSARRYIVYVQNQGQWSNATELVVVQAVPVGNTPVGVAVDQDIDQAVVTNFGDDTVSILNLLTASPISVSPVSVGSNPEGVAVLSRLGLAVVANNGSNNVTIVDERGGINGFSASTTLALCEAECLQPTGVGINGDTGVAVVTNPNTASPSVPSTISLIALPATGTAGSTGLNTPVDQDPVAVAVDPTLDYAAVATASQSSSLDLVDLSFDSIVKSVSGFQLPTGVVFDPVNQDFLMADSVVNNIEIVDPNTFISTPIHVGIDPTSLDYNYQTSTLVTANAASNTLSIVSYVCPPNPNGPVNCAGPRVRDVLGVGGLLTPSSVVVGPNSIAIDLKLNLGVLVDQSNNRILLVPLSH